MAKNRAGRNRDKCKAYRANGTREKNKERKAAKRARKIAKRTAKRIDAIPPDIRELLHLD